MKCALEKKKNPKIYSGQTTMCGKPEHRRFYLYLARTRRWSPSRGSSPHKTAQKKSGFCLLALHLLDNVGITRIGDRQAADPEVLTASGTQVDVGSRVVVDSGLAKHGVVLDLRLPVKATTPTSISSKPPSQSQNLTHLTPAVLA